MFKQKIFVVVNERIGRNLKQRFTRETLKSILTTFYGC